MSLVCTRVALLPPHWDREEALIHWCAEVGDHITISNIKKPRLLPQDIFSLLLEGERDMMVECFWLHTGLPVELATRWRFRVEICNDIYIYICIHISHVVFHSTKCSANFQRCVWCGKMQQTSQQNARQSCTNTFLWQIDVATAWQQFNETIN